MTRREFQQLARLRLRDAAVLLRARRYDGAYYLCGYVVECALKACIAKQTRRFEFPDRQRTDQSWTHDLVRLLRASGLEPALQQDMNTDPLLGSNWAIVRGWNESKRYERSSAAAAQALYQAVIDDRHGVLPWLQRHW